MTLRRGRPREKPVGVELFCGAGGMSLGFEQAGVSVVAGIDKDPKHVAVHKKNFPHSKTIQADLSQITGEDIRISTGLGDRHIDILFGGPPCQGFSIGGVREEKDPRNKLLYDFARLVKELEPSYFVLENVEGLLLSYARPFLEGFLNRVDASGYAVVEDIKTLNANDFGVPQRRRRAFILGYKKNFAPPAYPQPPYNLADRLVPKVWDAISDLAVIDNNLLQLKNGIYTGELGAASQYAGILRGEIVDIADRSRKRYRNAKKLTGFTITSHKTEVIERFRNTIPGNSEPVSRFYRLSKEGIAPTLRAGTDSTRGSYTASRPIHPEYPRCITVREAARLQSFPDWFSFNETVWHGYRQVGNSVPPLLARAVAHALIGVWKQENRNQREEAR